MKQAVIAGGGMATAGYQAGQLPVVSCDPTFSATFDAYINRTGMICRTCL